MAAALWGKVYFNNNTFVGVLRQEPGGRGVFTYDSSYLETGKPAIAFTLPRRAAPHICEQGLHPFFDNLVAEGWLRNAQARALKTDPNNRFALLLAFGHDCAGAVSVVDPAPVKEPTLETDDPATAAALGSRASLSGVQPKLLAVKDGKKYRPARRDETCHYIAKLPSGALRDIVENEYLTTIAVRALLPDDLTVEATIETMDGVPHRTLMVKRFDRLPSGARIHFEEFNQLLGKRSGDDKYAAGYEDMAAFIRITPGCAPADAWRLFRRVMTCFITGNTDAHLKNFAMFHAQGSMQLTPGYDLVAAALYPEYNTLALSVDGAVNLSLDRLRPKHVIALGSAHGLGTKALLEAMAKIDQRRGAAEKAIKNAAIKIDAAQLGDDLLNLMERRWNGTFSSIGQFLLKKQSNDENA